MRNFNVWDEKIEMKTKNNTAHDFGRLSDVISHCLFNRLHQSQVDARLFLYLYYTKTSKFFKQCDFFAHSVLISVSFMVHSLRRKF